MFLVLLGGSSSPISQSVGRHYVPGIPRRGYRSARFRTNEEIDRERERFGIVPFTARIIEDIAARQALALDQDEQQRFEELQRELALQKIEWEGRYLELLNARRGALIDAEIAARLRQKLLDEENMMVLLLLASAI